MKSIISAADYDYLEIKKLIDRLTDTFSFLKCRTIGRSSAGRDIFCLTIGNVSEYVLYTAAFHGSEHITCNIALRFAEQLCEALQTGSEFAGLDARRALFGRGIMIVPLVNPDGCEIAIKGNAGSPAMTARIRRLCDGDFAHWNANLRGVDLNHNFDAGWQELKKLEQDAGIFGPGPTRFGGFSPESEPETLALTELCRTTHIRHVISLHTQGEVIFWSYGDRQPLRSSKMAEILALQSGYALEVPTGISVGGGFKDWFIEEFSRPGFTVEIGKGKNPLPMSDMPKLYDDVKDMLMIAAIM